MKFNINENDIKLMAYESIRRIMKESHGYVSPDGNGMTGGYWGGSNYKKTISFDPRNYLENTEISADEYDILDEGLKEEYSATLSVSSSYDESTGYGSRYCPVIDFDDVEISKDFYTDVNNLQIDESIKEQVIDAVTDGLYQYEGDVSDDYDEDYDEDWER